MCYAVIVGKHASADGGVLFGHNEQNCGPCIMNYHRIPRLKHEKGALVRLKNGGTLPQVAETYSFLWAETPGAEYSDNYFNEWGVAVAGDGCPTREDDYDVLQERGQIVDGGIGYMLPRLIAERAKTAREGMHLAAELLNHFGYASTGRTLTIADPEEAWVISIARGKSWIARRVPDDAVVIVPNVHIIGADTDLSDKANVYTSPGLLDYVAARGWYVTGDSRFSFRKAFNTPIAGTMEELGHCSRQWHGQALITGRHAEIPATAELPFSVVPQKKLGVQDVMGLLRSHLEDTEYDYSRTNAAGTPHRPEHEIDNAFARGACNIATQESVIWQLRSHLPRQVGCVAWRATSVPCSSVYTPWYLGIDAIPEVYSRPGSLEEKLDLAHHFAYDPQEHADRSRYAYGIFYGLTLAVDHDYGRAMAKVKPAWQAFEAVQFNLQQTMEETALGLLEEDPDLARAFLTEYTAGRAALAIQMARQMTQELTK